MSLSLSLNNAISGLRLNQQSIAVLSHNIANVNTEGYSRQIIDQSAVYIEGVGNGVQVDDVIRKVDKYLARAVQTQGSNVARTDVVRDYFARAQTLLGTPGLQNSIDSFITGFFNSLQQLAGTPERTSYRANAINAAITLSDSISNLAAAFYDLRFEADRDMRDTVSLVNQTLVRLRDTNLALSRAEALGQSTAGLLDQRDAALRELSSYLDISTVFKATGEVNIIAGDGVSLLDDSVHELSYSSVQSVNNLIAGLSLNDLEVLTLDADGNSISVPLKLITANDDGTTTSSLTGGKIEGLRLLRDEVFPGMLDQLDMLAANLRDAMNAIHNDGSGFPPPRSLTGTRSFVAADLHSWSGTVRIAVLQNDGSPVPARYTDESHTGVRPLLLDFQEIYPSDTSSGQHSMQSIINEINHHFGAAQAKATVGVLNNIELASLQNSVTGGTFAFDFELENIANEVGDFFVTNVTVLDDTAANITNVTQAAPTLTLDPVATYITTNLSASVQINFLDIGDLQVGDMVYLGPPGAANVNGILAANLTGYFEVEAISGDQITITAGAAATSSGTVADASGVLCHPPYERVVAGNTTRTWDQGSMAVDFSGNATSAYYDVTVDVGVVDEDGNVVTSQITYRVNNNQSRLLNDRYAATNVAGAGTRVLPSDVRDTLRAVMVDAEGDEVPLVNGEYSLQTGYLKLIGSNTEYVVAIDELDSQETGNAANGIAGTDRGFSHFFELNNFFASNDPTSTGDTVHNSAINLNVEQRLIDNSNLISTGGLTLSPQSASPSDPRDWTYMRYAGDNQLVARLSGLANTTLSFDAAGGLPGVNLTLAGYSSELLGFMSAQAAAADDDSTNASTLYNSFKEQMEAVAGVNLDEELANTVIFQNAYSATARIISVVDSLFEDLLNTL